MSNDVSFFCVHIHYKYISASAHAKQEKDRCPCMRLIRTVTYII